MMNKTIIIGKQFEFDFELEIRNMYFEPFQLTLCEEESGKNRFVFRSKEHGCDLIATVSVESREGADAIHLSCDVNPRGGYDMRYHLAAYNTATIRLVPKKEPENILASVYHIGEKSDCWTTPAFVNAFSDIPNRAISVAWQSEGVEYHMLSMCHGECKTDMKVVDGAFSLITSPYCSGVAAINNYCVTIAYGDDQFAVAKSAVDSGYDFLGRKRVTAENTRVSDVFNYLGWCTWDSMHLDVTEEGILKKAKEFNDKGIPVRWLLIDDGWYGETERRAATSFYEDKAKFPNGLKACVDRLKKENSMKYVGIWECLGGGWGGIAPDSEIVREHPDLLIKLPNGYYFPRTDEAGSFAYWNMRHSYLSDCGFDFVKVDVECNTETSTHGLAPIGKSAMGMHRGLDGSAGIYFDGACINCTGMGAEELWNRPVGMVNRNSEDFEPTRVSTMSNFISCNIYNSLWHSNFCTPDWDMMWSDSETTKLNVVMHAISGSCVYLSDPHGMSKRESVLPFCLSDGYMLKCDRFAMPTKDRLYRDARVEDIAMKAWSACKESGMLAVFNIQKNPKPVSDSIKPSDVEYIKGDRFLLYEYFGKDACVLSRDESIDVKIPEYDAKLYSVSPYKNGIAVVGCTDKYVPYAVIENEIHTEASDIYTLYEGVKFTFASDIPVKVFVNGESVSVISDGILSHVDASGVDGKVIIEIKR
ncbi:MAG: alpha-galactosidase [Clostridia bacterium]|nr:alpha-galactosidase [Clostridia bacterium]